MIIGFISPLEVLFVVILFGLPVFLVIFGIIYFLKKRTGGVAKELEKQSRKYEEALFVQKDIRDYYPVKQGNKIVLIRFDEIVDFSVDNYVFLTDINGNNYLVDSNLTDLEGKLPKEYIRVHKSTIVNKNLIKEIKKLGNGRFSLIMKCEKERVIACSKSYNDNIKSIINY